jgi:hypothetical protein
VEEIGGGGGGSGDGGGDGCGNTLGLLPLVNDTTFVTMTFLTRPTTSMRCRDLQGAAHQQPTRSGVVSMTIMLGDDVGSNDYTTIK